MDGQQPAAREENRPVFTKFVRLPWGTRANARIVAGHAVAYDELDAPGEPVEISNIPEEVNFVEMGQAAIFRDITLAPVTVYPVQTDENGRYWIATDVRIEIEPAEPIPGPRSHHPIVPYHGISTRYTRALSQTNWMTWVFAWRNEKVPTWS